MRIVTEQTAGAGAEIRVGLIGYGLAGRAFHAPLIATTPGMRLAAVVTSDPGRTRQVAKDHPGASVVESAARLWDRAGELDLVVVASPNRTHAPLARQALAAGLPVVIDKPFAVTADEGRALIDEARRAGLLLTVFQNRRWDGDFLTLRRLMAGGALGEVHRFESRFERWRPTPTPGWREQGDPAEAGGILYDLGSHLIDQALVLFGPATHVYAELDRRRPGVEVDDDAFVALTHASGVRSHLWMSALAADDGTRMRVLGSRAAQRLAPRPRLGRGAGGCVGAPGLLRRVDGRRHGARRLPRVLRPRRRLPPRRLAPARGPRRRGRRPRPHPRRPAVRGGGGGGARGAS